MAAFATFVVAGISAQGVRNGLSRAPHVWLIEVGAAIAAFVAFQALWSRSYMRARVAAALQVALIVLGWGVAQYPYFVRPELTIFNSAAPANVVLDLVIAVAVGAIVLIPSLGVLFMVFKEHRKSAPNTNPLATISSSFVFSPEKQIQIAARERRSYSRRSSKLEKIRITDMKKFRDLSERETLALAISLEEEDERVYADFSEGLRQEYPGSSAVFDSMHAEESQHRRRLIDLYREKFGEHIPLIRRQDVTGFVTRTPVWLIRPLGLDIVRKQASAIEVETRRFYERAAAMAQDASIRQLLHDLAQEERYHEDRAQELTETNLRPEVREDEEKARRRLFVLQIVQPGLAGLMDGSVSTLAPVFAAALATRNSWEAFLVGLAASAGAGISMGFAEALSDDGSLTGRGHPWVRGMICGVMTTLGGIGHTLPFLIPEFRLALVVAMIVVIVELGVITWVRHRYMDTPILPAALQVGLGGALVFITGVLIGQS